MCVCRSDVSGLIEKNATRFTANRSHIVRYTAVYNIHSFIEGNPVSRSRRRRIGWGDTDNNKNKG